MRTGDIKDDLFIIPEYIESNLSEEQFAEKMADYFSNISQEYEPLCFESLWPKVKTSLLQAKNDPDIPILEEHEVYRTIMKAKKTSSVIEGDVPMRILHLFAPEMALPASLKSTNLLNTQGSGLLNPNVRFPKSPPRVVKMTSGRF